MRRLLVFALCLVRGSRCHALLQSDALATITCLNNLSVRHHIQSSPSSFTYHDYVGLFRRSGLEVYRPPCTHKSRPHGDLEASSWQRLVNETTLVLCDDHVHCQDQAQVIPVLEPRELCESIVKVLHSILCDPSFSPKHTEVSKSLAAHDRSKDQQSPMDAFDENSLVGLRASKRRLQQVKGSGPSPAPAATIAVPTVTATTTTTTTMTNGTCINVFAAVAAGILSGLTTVVCIWIGVFVCRVRQNNRRRRSNNDCPSTSTETSSDPEDYDDLSGHKGPVDLDIDPDLPFPVPRMMKPTTKDIRPPYSPRSRRPLELSSRSEKCVQKVPVYRPRTLPVAKQPAKASKEEKNANSEASTKEKEHQSRFQNIYNLISLLEQQQVVVGSSGGDEDQVSVETTPTVTSKDDSTMLVFDNQSCASDESNHKKIRVVAKGHGWPTRVVVEPDSEPQAWEEFQASKEPDLITKWKEEYSVLSVAPKPREDTAGVEMLGGMYVL